MSIHRTQVRIALLFGALLLAPLLAAAGPSVAEALEIGEKAPDFTLPSTTGGTISLGQFRGKKLVLLEFYAADFSPV
jgi:hypothetical protein